MIVNSKFLNKEQQLYILTVFGILQQHNEGQSIKQISKWADLTIDKTKEIIDNNYEAWKTKGLI